jgi:tripartite ATP-independent transporter DctM subunit
MLLRYKDGGVEMSNDILGIIMLACLVLVIFCGFPIVFMLVFVTVIFGYMGLGTMVFKLMITQTFGLMQEETLAAVPMFIFMGYITEQSGLMERLFGAFQHLFSSLKGALYIGVVLTATIFAMATGIVGASVTVLGIIAAPTMIKSNYDTKLSAGAICAGGTLGILIPPSVMLIVMGPVLGVSVARLYAAAFIPGFILGFCYILYLLIYSYLNPKKGPALPPESMLISVKTKLIEFVRGVIPLLVLICATLGSIIAGLATPTEAASVGAVGALLLSLAYRKISWRQFRTAAIKTLETTGSVMFLAVCANMFGATFARLGSADLMTKVLLALPFSPFMLITIIMVLIFLLGWPFEWPAIVLIFVPIFLPLVVALKVDMVWFGIITAVNLQTAFLSPPVAMSAYFLKGAVPEWSLSDIYAGMMQFIVIQFIVLILIMVFPDIVLIAPRLLFDSP